MRGFTLIEAIVYISLLSILMLGGLSATYEIISGQSQAANHNTSSEEGSFVMRKIEWALNDVTATSSPSVAFPYTSTLDIWSNGNTHIIVSRDSSGLIQMSENGHVYPITSGNATTASLRFHYIASTNDGPEGIEASTTIGGEEFDMIRYLREP